MVGNVIISISSDLIVNIAPLLIGIHTPPLHTHTAEDCYTVGRQAYQQKYYQHTCSWMLEALKKFDMEGGTSKVDLPSVYDHLSFSGIYAELAASYRLSHLMAVVC